jgi:hypothetical protein
MRRIRQSEWASSWLDKQEPKLQQHDWKRYFDELCVLPILARYSSSLHGPEGRSQRMGHQRIAALHIPTELPVFRRRHGGTLVVVRRQCWI